MGGPPPHVPSPGRGFRGFVRRRPVVAVLGASVTALMAGVAIGQSDTVPAAEHARARAALADTRADLRATESELASESERANAAEADASDLAQRVEELTAVGEVPDFTGDTISDARDDSLLSDFDWKVETVEQPSREPEGTVLAQSPQAGRELKRGRSVTLTVASPMPKQWTTVASFSGAGSKRTDEFTIPGGLKTRAVYSYTGDTNAILELKAPGDGEFGGDLLLNEIGDYSDSTRLYDKRGTYYFDVQGGSWTVAVQVFK
jgi:hypothetical protein